MKDIDETDAPIGYVAVFPHNKRDHCVGCAFEEHFYACFRYSQMCNQFYREDKQSVIFIKKSENEE